jgi:hypothetical protein
MNERYILDAIYEDDRAAVKRLLHANRTLANLQIGVAELFTGKIQHWIYAGDTPLHLAAAGYRVEIVEMLLAAGADPNASMNHRRSGPLHYAADTCLSAPAWEGGRQVETIRRLLAAGACINAQDKNGATPLHRAVRTRGAEAVKCLLAAGADPLMRNLPGSTPFHLAVQNTGRGGSGNEAAKRAQCDIIKQFLSARVSVALKDGKGKSVRQCAQNDLIREMLGG